MLSLVVMSALKRIGGFSVTGVSIAGGVFHNIGQLLVAFFAVQTARVVYYTPVLMIAGVVTGFLIGIISNEVLKRLNLVF